MGFPYDPHAIPTGSYGIAGDPTGPHGIPIESPQDPRGSILDIVGSHLIPLGSYRIARDSYRIPKGFL
eukprot:1137280-Pyramimonas_sp.AAC.1